MSACAIMKDEADYILEWIAFHRVVGFEYFYIYDNDSSDGTEAILTPLEAYGICKRIHWPRSQHPDNPQVAAYRHVLETFGQDSNWLAIIDADEFVVPLTSDSVSEILRNNFQTAPAIVCNWKVFGSAGHKHASERFCIDRFVRSSTRDYLPNRNVKSIVRPEFVELAFQHNHYLKNADPVLSDGSKMPEPRSQFSDVVYGHLQINHYYCKSYEEFLLKRSKGLADYPLDSPLALRSIEAFHNADCNDVEDLSAYRFLQSVRCEYHRLLAVVSRELSAPMKEIR